MRATLGMTKGLTMMLAAAVLLYTCFGRASGWSPSRYRRDSESSTTAEALTTETEGSGSTEASTDTSVVTSSPTPTTTTSPVTPASSSVAEVSTASSAEVSTASAGDSSTPEANGASTSPAAVETASPSAGAAASESGNSSSTSNNDTSSDAASPSSPPPAPPSAEGSEASPSPSDPASPSPPKAEEVTPTPSKDAPPSVSPDPPSEPPKEEKNEDAVTVSSIDCGEPERYVKFRGSVSLICVVRLTAETRASLPTWYFDAYFRTAEFYGDGKTGHVDRVVGVDDVPNAGSAYPRTLDLVFSAFSRDNKTIWTNPDETDRQKLSVDESGPTFNLTLEDVQFSDDGTFEFVLSDSSHAPRLRTGVSIRVGRRPKAMDVYAPAVLIGERYKGSCVVRNFYPPGSVTLTWRVNGNAFTPGEASDGVFWWIDGSSGVTLAASATLSRAEEGTPPPSISCYAEWKFGNATSSCNAVAMSRSYHAPVMSISFSPDGYAVCDARCVPYMGDLFMRWSVDGATPPDADAPTNVTGPCTSVPGYVDLQSRVPLRETEGTTRYTCLLLGFPIDSRSFEINRYYDSTQRHKGRPVIVTLASVFATAMVLASIIMIAALCFYRAGVNSMYV
uniref:Marek's disease glycoprotein A n=1 Tax=Anatid alphaherpesvirus 2 TaxID=3080522 RepID=A0AAU0K898_9ALPH